MKQDIIVIEAFETSTGLVVGRADSCDCRELDVCGSAFTTTVSSGGTMIVSGFDASAQDTSITDGGKMTVLSGAKVSGTTIDRGGYMTIGDRCSAVSLQLNNNDGIAGSATILSGGFVEAVTMAEGARLTVSSGGSAFTVNVMSGANLVLQRLGNAAVASCVTLGSGGMVNGVRHCGSNDAYIDCMKENGVGGSASGWELENQKLALLSQAEASAFVVRGNESELSVENGARLLSARIETGGRTILHNDAYASCVELSDGGQMVLENGALAEYTSIGSGGIMQIKGGASANYTSVLSGGQVILADEDSVLNNVTVESGAALGDFVQCGESPAWIEYWTKRGVSGSVRDVVFSGGQMIVATGGTADNCRVYGNGDSKGKIVLYGNGGSYGVITAGKGGEICIESGASVASAVIERGGLIDIRGSANDICLSSGASGKLYSGASVTNIRLETGAVLLNDGTVNAISADSGTVIVNNGYLYNASFSSGVTLKNEETGDFTILSESGTYITSIESGSIYGGVDNLHFSGFTRMGTTAIVTSAKFGGNSELYMEGGEIGTLDMDNGGRFYANGGVISSGYATGPDTRLIIQGETSANYLTIDSGAIMIIYSAAKTDGLQVNSGSFLQIEAGGHASNTYLAPGARVLEFTQGSHVPDYDSFAYIQNIDFNGIFGDTDQLDIASGRLLVQGGGTMTNTHIGGGTDEALMHFEGGGTVLSGTSIHGNGKITGYGVSLYDTLVQSNGIVSVNDVTLGGTLTIAGTMELTNNAKIDEKTGLQVYFDVRERSIDDDYLLNNIVFLDSEDTLFTVTVSSKMEPGAYFLALVDGDFSKNMYLLSDNGGLGQEIVINGDFVAPGDGNCYALVMSSAEIVLLVIPDEPFQPTELKGDMNGLSWTPASSATTYEVVLEKYGSRMTVNMESDVPGVKFFGTPSGKYEWKVRSKGTSTYVNAEPFTVQNTPAADALYESDGAQNCVFFVTPATRYRSVNYAVHTETGSKASTLWKNSFHAVCHGAEDKYDVLILTDDSWGDAFFLEDNLSKFPSEITVPCARFSGINEILAGAGDDFVDLTSNQYTTGDIIVKGGDGNDILWGNQKSASVLFGGSGNDELAGGNLDDILIGGAGDDRMFGGTGDNIYVFSDNWGNDMITDNSDGKVKLWFSESVSTSLLTWETRDGNTILTLGDNSITVRDAIFSDIEVIRGDDSSATYQYLVQIGAFDA